MLGVEDGSLRDVAEVEKGILAESSLMLYNHRVTGDVLKMLVQLLQSAKNKMHKSFITT